MTMKTNIMLVSSLVVIILTLAGITYTYTRIISHHTVENHQQNLAKEAGRIAELWLNQRFKIIASLAKTLEQRPPAQDAETLMMLKMIMEAGDFSDVYVGLADGTMIDGADWPPPLDYDPRVRPWYKRAISENDLSLTRPYLDLTTRKMVIAVVTPLVRNGRFLGVLSSDIILDTLEANVMDLRIGESGYAFIIDSLGTVLVHHNQDLLMTTLIQDTEPGLSGFSDYFPQRDSGSYSYVAREEDRMISFHKLVDTGWYLCTNVASKEAFALAKNTNMLFAMRMVLKILGILALLLFLTVGGFALIFLISKHRFEAIVSGKDRDLKGEIIRRKELETRYRTLFNMATNAIMLSKKGTYIECNKKAMDMFGLPRDKIIGRSMLDLSPATQQGGCSSVLTQEQLAKDIMEGHLDVFKWTFKRADGTEFPTEIGMNTLKLNREMVTIYSIWDISKRVNAEQHLRQAQKMAAMGEMLSAIAHQWRQPLNALSTYIASLTPAFYNQIITKEFIEKLVRESDSQIQFMSRTINDFKEYFRPSKNKHTFNVMNSVKNAFKLIQPQLRQNNIILDLDSPAAAEPLQVFGYENEFVHVLVNIISNAKDAINERQANTSGQKINRLINISVTRDTDMVLLSVKDTGCGIPRHLLDKIFTPYFTTKGTAMGTGIGLYMAKMIVEKEMKGQIIVENLSIGVMFQIRLPLSSPLLLPAEEPHA